ncbi:MAG: pseudouridine synthase [Clostridiales bacterium]|nr:pseudouridine synthase [Clostridiales bacterium]
MRLDKFLSEMGVGSRSQIKEWCRQKKITVNGEVVRKSDFHVDPMSDQVICQGQRIAYEEMEYYMLHKPKGVVTAVSDSRESTVMDLLKERKRKDLFPVGRLDKDTTGLLIITNDGPLCRRLLAPKHHVPKTYYARVKGRITEAHVGQFLQGLDIGDEKMTLPAKLKILKEGDISQTELTITEGRFHQVKRMFHAVGGEVLDLKRLSMGELKLDPNLAPGEYRKLTPEEVEILKNQS